MRHLGFLKDLEHVSDHADAWNTLAAGYRLLVLLDAAADNKRFHVGRPLAQEIRELAAAHLTPATGQALAELAESVIGYRPARVATRDRVLKALLAYAEALQMFSFDDAVFDTVTAALGMGGDSIPPGIAWRCLKVRGVANRAKGRFDAALDDYREVIAIGEQTHDIEATLRGRGSVALIAMMRGDLPAAEQALRTLLAEALATGPRHVVGTLAQDLGSVLGMRGKREEALETLTFALEHLEGINRDVGLANLGLTKAILGDAAGARTILEGMVVGGAYTAAVWRARGHLMEMDAEAGSRAAVEAHVAALFGAPLPPLHRAWAKLSAGRAYKILGDRQQAAIWLEQSLHDAERVGQGNIVFEAEEELDGLLGKNWRTLRNTPTSAAASVPLNLPATETPAAALQSDPAPATPVAPVTPVARVAPAARD